MGKDTLFDNFFLKDVTGQVQLQNFVLFLFLKLRVTGMKKPMWKRKNKSTDIVCTTLP